jgi:hypothetical protein
MRRVRAALLAAAVVAWLSLGWAVLTYEMSGQAIQTLPAAIAKPAP